MKIFGREPSLIIAFIGALLTWAAGMNLSFLTAGQATAITTFVTGVIIAFTTRPIAPGLFAALVGVAASLFGEYGLHWSEAQVTGLAGVFLASFALMGIRPQVTPKDDPQPIAPAVGAVR